jgi:hypothetical protein
MSREGTEKYDDSATGGYSYPEKLAAVAEGLMDPKSIGLPPDKAGQKAAIEEMIGQKPTLPKFGDFITFEASVVPQELRAHWARQDTGLAMDKAAAADWEAQWIEKHAKEYAIQGRIHSGTIAGQFGQIFSDPILGFCEMLRKTADMLQDRYNELLKTDPNPIVTRYDKDRETAPQASVVASES